MFFSATQARTVFLAFVTNDIFFSVRQAVNHAALGTGLVFELPIIAGSTIPHFVEDPVVYPHGFTTLGAVFEFYVPNEPISSLRLVPIVDSCAWFLPLKPAH